MQQLRRVLSGDKVVDSAALNRAGVQPARAVLARALYAARRPPHDALLGELGRFGIVVVEDFLPDDLFAAALREAEEYEAEVLPRWLHEHGGSVVSTYRLRDADPLRFANLVAWTTQPQVLAIASGAERRPVRGNQGAPLLEHIRFGEPHHVDPQTILHADTFFHTHKVWLYLDDVTEHNGALVYVPRSHLLDATRLGQEYAATTGRTNCPEPSRRVGDDEVRRRGLEPVAVKCRRNTLVVVNTCGYHCRSVGDPGESRRALHMAFRFDPFRYPMPRTARTLRGARRVARGTLRSLRG